MPRSLVSRTAVPTARHLIELIARRSARPDLTVYGLIAAVFPLRAKKTAVSFEYQLSPRKCDRFEGKTTVALVQGTAVRRAGELLKSGITSSCGRCVGNQLRRNASLELVTRQGVLPGSHGALLRAVCCAWPAFPEEFVFAGDEKR
jgi:hypothetical protein